MYKAIGDLFYLPIIKSLRYPPKKIIRLKCHKNGMVLTLYLTTKL